MYMLTNSSTDAAIIRAAQDGATLVRVTARINYDHSATALKLRDTREKYGLVQLAPSRFLATDPTYIGTDAATRARNAYETDAALYVKDGLHVYWLGPEPSDNELDEIAAALTGTAIGGIVTVAVTTPTGEETEVTTLSIPEILPKWWEWNCHAVRRRVVDVAPEPVKKAVSNYLLWALPTNLPETGEVTIR